jgi:SAM-dependent methyltransferase
MLKSTVFLIPVASMMGYSRRRLLGTTFSVAFAWSQQPPSKDNTARYWDEVFTAEKPVFLRQPTELLVQAVQGRRPGKAVDIGMGQGRNAVFLAQQGWDVTGFDPSEGGVRQAQTQAKKLGVALRTLVMREEDFDFGSAQWDLIVMTYVRRLRAGDAERFTRSLRPNGIFIYENNNVVDGNDILREMLSFRILRFEDVHTKSDWHPREGQRVQRLIAEKVEAH